MDTQSSNVSCAGAAQPRITDIPHIFLTTIIFTQSIVTTLFFLLNPHILEFLHSCKLFSFSDHLLSITHSQSLPLISDITNALHVTPYT